MSPARTLRGLALLVAAVLALAACSGSAGERAADAPTPAGGTASPTPVPTGLERFYAQQLRWAGCGGDFDCTRLTVPIDYAAPTGATIELNVIRLKASDEALGSLVINPGGPGGSGVGYARTARAVISDAVRKRYDVVGFDPRGVGASAPLACLSGPQTDELVAADPSPDDATEVAATVRLFEQLGERCRTGGGALLAHVSTPEVARDLDVLRAALGDTRLTYLGKSYGTLIGATYAELFPANVGRVVLDGVIDPALTSEQVALGQATGFERATRAFVSDCNGRDDCPLGSSLDGGMERLRGLLRTLDASPLPTGDAGRPLTEGVGSLGVAIAMYDQGFWPSLREALNAAFGGDGAPLLRLSDAYTERRDDGTYAGNQNTVIYAVNCLDRGAAKTLDAVRESVPTFTEQAPTWGAFLAWSELPCAYWPVKGTGAPHPVAAAGSGPIVVVGTTRDPATPYEWAVSLSEELADGHLITYDGDGHTAYLRGSRCVDKAVDAYLLKGKVPKAGLSCD